MAKQKVNGFLGQNRLSNRRVGLAQSNLGFGPTEDFAPTPLSLNQRTSPSQVGPLLSGLQAAQGFGGATDTTGGVISALGAAGTGAATGALFGGGVPGALVGGAVGGLGSALNSWLGIRAENKRSAEMEAFIREVEEKNARRERQARQDELTRFKFNRADVEKQRAITDLQFKRQAIFDMINNNQTLKDRFIQTGVR